MHMWFTPLHMLGVVDPLGAAAPHHHHPLPGQTSSKRYTKIKYVSHHLNTA